MKETNGKKALKSGVWYTVANFASRGLAFITMPIFTRLMSKADVGNFSNFASWLTILTSVITLDLHTSVTLAKFDYKEKISEYISSMLILGTIVTSVIFLCSLPFKGLIKNTLSLNEIEYYLLFIIPLFSPALQMYQIKNRLMYKYKLSTTLSFGASLAGAIGGVVCVKLFQDKLLGRLLGSYGPVMLLHIIIYFYYISHFRGVNTKYWKYGLTISLPLIVHVLSGHLLSASDRIMITNICGSEYNALYSVAYSCSIIVSLLWVSMNTAWAPWAYEQMDKEKYDALKKASKPYLLFFGFIVFCFLLIAPDILLIMGGKAYESAIGVIPPVMVAFVFQFVYSLYVNIETFSKKQKYIAIGTSIAALLNICLNIVFIPLFGYIAAAYTTLAGYAVLFIVHFLFVRHLGREHWYDTKFNMLFVTVFIILMIGVQFLYLNNTVRFLIIGIIFTIVMGVIILLHKEIAYLIKNRSNKMLKDRCRSIKAKLEKY